MNAVVVGVHGKQENRGGDCDLLEDSERYVRF